MIAEETKDLIEALRADLSSQVRDLSDALHKRLDAIHDKHNTTLSALAHLIQRVHDMTTVSDLKDDVVALEGDVDALLAKFDQTKADAEAADDAAADDIRTSLHSIISKVAARLGGSDASTGTQQSTDTSTPKTKVESTSTTATTQDGSTTTVDHTTGQASTTDANGSAVATDESAAQAARDAAASAGVAIPSA